MAGVAVALVQAAAAEQEGGLAGGAVPAEKRIGYLAHRVFRPGGR